MEQHEASSLAVRISQYWPRGGLSTEVWEHKLKAYDHDYAVQALKRMTETLRHPPVVADFVAEYRPPRRERVECERCDGGGWVDVHDERRHARHCTDHDACGCHAVEPCTCAAGEEVRPGYERLLAHDPRRSTT